MRMKTVVHAALGLTLLSGVTLIVSAQPIEGRTVSGFVIDPSGALIPHAKVTIVGGSGYTKAAVKNGITFFKVDHLAQGRYSVSSTAPGFMSTLNGDGAVFLGKLSTETIKLGISLEQEKDVAASGESAEQRGRPSFHNAG